MCLGVVHGRKEGIVSSSFGRKRPNLTKTLVNFAKAALPKDFHFTSIQVNKNYLSALHVDKNNLGPSYIVGVGDYEDGGLWVQTMGAVDCNHKWKNFDGNIPHCTLPYTGTRYTLIYFANQSYEKLGDCRPEGDDQASIKSLGFPLPPPGKKKAQYATSKVRLRTGKAAFRKWQDCEETGADYSWSDSELDQWAHDSDEEESQPKKRKQSMTDKRTREGKRMDAEQRAHTPAENAKRAALARHKGSGLPTAPIKHAPPPAGPVPTTALPTVPVAVEPVGVVDSPAGHVAPVAAKGRSAGDSRVVVAIRGGAAAAVPAAAAAPAAQCPLALQALSGQVVSVDKPRVTMGRGKRADVVITGGDAFMQTSRMHAALTFDGRRLLIEDLGSVNGTCVNGERLPPHTPRELSAGACVVLGMSQSRELTFEVKPRDEVTSRLGV